MPKILILGKGTPSVYMLDKVFIEPATKINLSSNKIDWGYKQLYYPMINNRPAKSVKVVYQKEWLVDHKDELDKADLILCTDSSYFKTLIKSSKADALIGKVLDSPYTTTKIMYAPNVYSYNYNPDKVLSQVETIYSQLKEWFKGTYVELGSTIIKSSYYPNTLSDIEKYLKSIINEPVLAIDIETFSLKFTRAGIGSIGFATDKHNGCAFAVDLNPSIALDVRKLLKEFFITYKGKKIFHKVNYDVTVLIYELFMDKDLTNHTGLMEGLNAFFNNNLDDTVLITYLATNSCAGNTLKLKQLASPFAGDWAVDVEDITSVKLEDLLKYNLIDCLSTHYVYEKYYPIMVQDKQEELYKGLFLDTLRTNVRMQLIGLPINLEKVKALAEPLEKEREDLIFKLSQTKPVKEAEEVIAERATIKRNSKLKKKQTSIDDNRKPFLFTSNNDIAILLYEVMKLPIIEFTDSKLPSTSKKTIKKLMNHTTNTEELNVLQWLQEFADVDKILSSFIPTFLEAETDKYGNSYLQGSFNLCGTVSGRLSSSQPNLQNLPATGSRFAKPIKQVFESNNEWLFVGIDFFSLKIGERYSNVTC